MDGPGVITGAKDLTRKDVSKIRALDGGLLQTSLRLRLWTMDTAHHALTIC